MTVNQANIRADARDIRADLIRSLQIPMKDSARAQLRETVRGLVASGDIKRRAARELYALIGREGA